MWCAFTFFLTLLVRLLRAACKPRDELVLENLALRQQLTALKLGARKPRLHDADRACWVALRKSWSGWAARLVIVKPETVVDWQRRHFRRHWTKISQRSRRPGRPLVDAEIRDLVRQMLRENDWGAPRIFSEPQKLGFVVSETTVSRYVRQFRQRNPDPDVLKRWIAFLRNHKDAIAGMDFFTVPTAHAERSVLLLYHPPLPAPHTPLQRDL